MAVNTPTGDRARKGAVRKRSQLKTRMAGEARWTERSRETGHFLDVKTSPEAKKFERVRHETSA